MKETAFEINGVIVLVTTHDTIDEMNRFILSAYGVAHPDNKGGAFTIWRDGKVHVHFAQQMLLLDFVAHEAFHVAMCIGRAMGMDNIDEEPLAEAAGEFVRLYVNHIFDIEDDYSVMINKKLLSPIKAIL